MFLVKCVFSFSGFIGVAAPVIATFLVGIFCIVHMQKQSASTLDFKNKLEVNNENTISYFLFQFKVTA